jgi:uncharacterized membrane protein
MREADLRSRSSNRGKSRVIFRLLAGAALLAAPAAASEADLPLPLNCSGSEPFWSLTIRDAKTAHFNSDVEETDWRIARIGHASQRPTTWRVIFKGKLRHALIFDEGQQGCSDNDGDEPLAYGLLLEDGDGLLRGCCNPKR